MPAAKYFPFLNAQEIMSAIILASPAIWCEMMLEACARCICRPKNCRRWPTITEEEFCSLYPHATADVLSQKVARWQCSRGRFCWQSARKPRTAPVSSNLFMVMLPLGLASVINADLMSCGHLTCQRKGVSSLVPLHHTPPAPRPHASV